MSKPVRLPQAIMCRLILRNKFTSKDESVIIAIKSSVTFHNRGSAHRLQMAEDTYNKKANISNGRMRSRLFSIEKELTNPDFVSKKIIKRGVSTLNTSMRAKTIYFTRGE